MEGESEVKEEEEETKEGRGRKMGCLAVRGEGDKWTHSVPLTEELFHTHTTLTHSTPHTLHLL